MRYAWTPITTAELSILPISCSHADFIRLQGSCISLKPCVIFQGWMIHSFMKVWKNVSTYFPVSWQDNFFDRLEENTSRDGFLHGKYWQDLRKRCRNFLEESGFIDHELEFVAPFKFSGFFYPDDFVDRKCHCISIYGEVASDSEWNKLKKMVRDDYAAYARKQKVTSGKNIALQGMCLPEIEG